jgi:hypothetical protein
LAQFPHHAHFVAMGGERTFAAICMEVFNADKDETALAVGARVTLERAI